MATYPGRVICIVHDQNLNFQNKNMNDCPSHQIWLKFEVNQMVFKKLEKMKILRI
jgi:hypothetical protein